MGDTRDVAIVGSGPAGLSAALLLGRSRLRVVVCDHGRPRNRAAQAVHGFLGLDGLEPSALRERGKKECLSYGVAFVGSKVIRASSDEVNGKSLFQLELENGEIIAARKLLLATGVEDQLPEVTGLNELYGVSVHHCPYCDGWEHQDERLVALGDGDAAVTLSITLLNWSRDITCCTNGAALNQSDSQRLQKYEIKYRHERITELTGRNRVLEQVHFAVGTPIECDALFFSADQGQRSNLPQMLGCNCNEEGLVISHGKQGSGVRGLFIAGDADGDVQFAIVAAAEGAIAATAINSELQAEDYP
jgi:thioredoxin reductase